MHCTLPFSDNTYSTEHNLELISIQYDIIVIRSCIAAIVHPIITTHYHIPYYLIS